MQSSFRGETKPPGDPAAEGSQMVSLRKRGLAIALSAAIGVGVLAAPAAVAGVPPTGEPPANCNSGNGNGSELVTFVEGAHCFGGDPGNSFMAGNSGGDEVPPGEENPGGNNVAP